VVFIPIGEPWRNGVVESFNDTYNRRFFRRQWFFGAIVTSDPGPRTLSSSITRTIAMAALGVRPPSKLSKKLDAFQPCRLRNSNSLRSTIFQKEPSPLSGLSEVIGSSISLENISSFLKLSSILMSELKLLRVCIKFRSILEMIWSPPYRTNYQNGLPQILKMGK